MCRSLCVHLVAFVWTQRPRPFATRASLVYGMCLCAAWLNSALLNMWPQYFSSLFLFTCQLFICQSVWTWASHPVNNHTLCTSVLLKPLACTKCLLEPNLSQVLKWRNVFRHPHTNRTSTSNSEDCYVLSIRLLFSEVIRKRQHSARSIALPVRGDVWLKQSQQIITAKLAPKTRWCLNLSTFTVGLFYAWNFSW